MVHFISRRTAWWEVGTISETPNHMVWRGAETADTITQDQFLADIKGQSTSGDVLVWVHGFNTSRSVALATVKKIKERVIAQGFKGTVIAYDWPTSSDAGLRGAFNRVMGLRRMYKKDKETANNMDDNLCEDLKFLFQASGVKVHIMAHSMGTYLTTLAVGHADSWLGTTKPFQQIIFGAADTDQKLLVESRWGGKALNRRCKRVTNIHSIDDDVLDVSGQVMYGGGKRAGKHGLLADAPDRFVDVSMARRFNHKHPTQPLRLSHNWYLTDDVVLTDVAVTLTGKSQDAVPTRHKDAQGWHINKA